ncbi:DNA-binding response regulator [Methylomonas sp. MgM2]
MKILIIDNAEQSSALFGGNVDALYFSDEIQALNAAEQYQPELILLNYVVRGEQTPEYIQLLLEVTKASKLVVIGNNTSEDEIFRCLLTGAKGFQDKKQLPRYINKLVQVVTRGEAWVSRKMVARIVDAIWHHDAQTIAA